jgi:hypothetical protein
MGSCTLEQILHYEEPPAVTDNNAAAAARRWIAERLLWERFLEQSAGTAVDNDDAVTREAA